MCDGFSGNFQFDSQLHFRKESGFKFLFVFDELLKDLLVLKKLKT